MKKIVAVVLCTVLLLTMFCGTALAGSDKALKSFEKEVKQANKEIKTLVKTARKTAEDDIDWMQGEIAKIVAEVQAKAAELDVQVECSMDTYWIDGQWVDVDPLIVINIGHKS